MLEGDDDRDLPYGNRGHDRQSGDAGNNDLRCGEGKDSQSGDGDNVLLRGGSGDEILSGGLGADTVKGDSGTDRVAGENGGGPDVGDDVLCFNRLIEIDEAFALDDDWNLAV